MSLNEDINNAMARLIDDKKTLMLAAIKASEMLRLRGMDHISAVLDVAVAEVRSRK